MIVISAFAQIQPDRVEEAKVIAATVMEATAREHGCLHYRFYQDIAAPERFHAYEEWTSDEVLDAHFQTEHVKAFFAAITPLLAAPPVITRHVVSSSGPL